MIRERRLKAAVAREQRRASDERKRYTAALGKMRVRAARESDALVKAKRAEAEQRRNRLDKLLKGISKRKKLVRDRVSWKMQARTQKFQLGMWSRIEEKVKSIVAAQGLK